MAGSGFPKAPFERHIAYDIGIEALVRRLAARLNVPAVLSGFSRLLIDPNRGEDDPTLIMKISDGAIIPGNHPITEEEWNARIESLPPPVSQGRFSDDRIVGAAGRQGAAGHFLHSYTPAWKGVPRPGMPPFSGTVIRAPSPADRGSRKDSDLLVGDNEPYDGALRGDTMYRHCMETGIAHALLEVRQDLIGDDSGVAEWDARLGPDLCKFECRSRIARNQALSVTDRTLRMTAERDRR
jgi:predicted N-formylglutamate amidohydrolase